jgi:hypothetical protein
LARSASGAVSFVGCGKTAVPGTRGMSSVSNRSTKSGKGPSTSTRRAVMIFLPRCQVVMTVTTIAATSSGRLASLSEDSKTSMSTSTPANSSQLTAGT